MMHQPLAVLLFLALLLQVRGLNGAREKELAEAFVDYVLSAQGRQS